MLPNLNTLVTPIVNKIQQFNSLDCALPQAFKDNVKSIKNGNVEYGTYSSCVTNKSGQKIYFSNNWFYIAAILSPLYKPFTDYKTLLTSIVDNDDLHNSAFSKIKASINASSLDPQDKDYLIKFATDPLWWNGGNSNTGGKTLERGDALVSSILSIANVVNASQSYVADLWKFFGENPDSAKLLNDYYDKGSTNAISNGIGKNLKQKIFFGAPGTGKSYTLDKETAGLDIIRTTFHPDSDYSTFVGVYKPVEYTEKKKQTIWDFSAKSAIEIPVLDQNGNETYETKISYRFIQQAFLKAYIEAWKKFGSVASGSVVCSPKFPVSSGNTPYSSSGFGAVSSFIYEKDNASLSPTEEGLLSRVDAFLFSFPEISCLADLHVQNDKIKVVVKDKPDKNRESLTVVIERERADDKNWLQSPDGKFAFRQVFPKLLGEYKADTKTVYLYKEPISNEDDPVKALIDTYIHEMFHALFDCGKYIPEIDEAIVECCTLCVLELLDSDSSFKGIFDYSLKNKEEKKISCPNYGYGVYLFNHRSLDWLVLFKNGNSSIVASDPLVQKYISLFHMPWTDPDKNAINAWRYPYEQENEALELLYEILTHTNSQFNSSRDVVLIIEEINRGNCAQIFGDVFQLLDRNGSGFSQYPISPDDDIRRCLQKEFANVTIPSCIDSLYKEPVADKVKAGELLLLPENLYIYATMNTSDQSLFPMDSAFKRRWDWRFFAIKDENKGYRIRLTDGTEYDWWETISKINSKILDTTKSADKQLGYWFAKLPEGKTEITPEVFVSKVVFYLWNDVFKDYSFGGNNPFSSDVAFEKFYDSEGKVVEETIKNFMKQNELNPIDA